MLQSFSTESIAQAIDSGVTNLETYISILATPFLPSSMITQQRLVMLFQHGLAIHLISCLKSWMP